MANAVLHSDPGRPTRRRSTRLAVAGYRPRPQADVHPPLRVVRPDSIDENPNKRVLPIPDALAIILKEFRSQWQSNPDGFLFITRNGRPPSSNKVVSTRLWPILDALSIPRCGLHAFRHSHASLLLDTGASPKVAQRRLRHSDARTTLEIYAHVVGNAQREAVEKVAAIVDATGRQPMTIN